MKTKRIQALFAVAFVVAITHRAGAQGAFTLGTSEEMPPPPVLVTYEFQQYSIAVNVNPYTYFDSIPTIEPVPEPSISALMILGAVLVLAFHRQRKKILEQRDL